MIPERVLVYVLWIRGKYVVVAVKLPHSRDAHRNKPLEDCRRAVRFKEHVESSRYVTAGDGSTRLSVEAPNGMTRVPESLSYSRDQFLLLRRCRRWMRPLPVSAEDHCRDSTHGSYTKQPS